MTEQDLAASVRTALEGAGRIHEVRMFGGIGFMLNGNMIAGASKRGLLLRVGKDREVEAMTHPGARPMEMRGRRMEGYIYIDLPALNNDDVGKWLQLAIPYVVTLPPKIATAKRRPKKTKK